MSYDVWQHKQGSLWWLVDTIDDALDGEDAILEAIRKSHGSARGKWIAYENTEGADLEIR